MNITELERDSLNKLKKGMDRSNEGWLHCMLPETKQTSGVVSSLTKKGLIDCQEDYELDGCYWVTVTESGQTI